MIAADLCSGIGGASCALEACGVEVVAHAEIELHASNVLKRRWPDVPNVGNWTLTKGRAAFREAAAGVDILTGGVPCQGYSAAGKRLGWADPRNLFPDLFALLAEWGDDGEPLYRISPQGPWEPPRVVVPVKGDRRRHRLRGLGNAWEQGTARTVVASVVASVREPAHA